VSDAGAFDMVGNLLEWVADWVPRSDGNCPGWAAFSDDFQCVSGALSAAGGPGALFRGGSFSNGAGAGVFAVNGNFVPYSASSSVGFRAAR
jgi:formylglycine-generating enzyme required for sulfatase activity